ncbi:MAG TPA: tRNA pseudouridine(13) synthase TruD [Gammaproteobacteria bacterium]|nr:tRNA pseudouridine(13) synthase TruD [Gammaproteobacteria bacterium]
MSEAPVVTDWTGIPPVEALPRAWGMPPVRGLLRAHPEDFNVEEVIDFTPEGRGEHVLLHVRKRGLNTEQVARRIARVAGVPRSEVSYAGLKDRHAVTTQWFSVRLGGASEPDWRAIEDEACQLIETWRHTRKLRRGALAANRFRIVVRALEGDFETLDALIATIARHGVPNYFGEQRFGRSGRNIERALALFRGESAPRDRTVRGLALSAARSALFNVVLARRVKENTWRSVLPGEAVILDGSRSFFICEKVDAPILTRLAAGDVHPSGPLHGAGESPVRGTVLALERQALAPFAELCAGLERAGLEQERRALRLLPRRFEATREHDLLMLDFELPAGAYATAVLRELVLGIASTSNHNEARSYAHRNPSRRRS